MSSRIQQIENTLAEINLLADQLEKEKNQLLEKQKLKLVKHEKKITKILNSLPRGFDPELFSYFNSNSDNIYQIMIEEYTLGNTYKKLLELFQEDKINCTTEKFGNLFFSWSMNKKINGQRVFSHKRIITLIVMLSHK